MLLNRAFGSVGQRVGSRPLLYFVISCAVILTSIVIVSVKPPKTRLSFDDGYTTKDAPSVRELKAQIEFFGNKGKPWYMALFATPRNGSMIESGEFKELENTYKGFKSNIVIRTNEDGKALTYNDFCDKTCTINDVLFTTFNMWFFGDLEWPVTRIFGYQSNIGKFFFERQMNGNNIKKANLTALYFMVFVNSTQMEDDMEEFERLTGLAVAEHNANPNMSTFLTQHSARGMQLEIKRGTSIVAKYVFVGMGLCAFVTLLSLVILNRVHGRCNGRVVPLFLVAFLIPFVSVITAAAWYSIFGGHLNTLIFLTPVVTVAVALDGMFILYNIWLRETNGARGSVADQMNEVFASALPSISMVIAPAVVLLFGALFPIEEFANLSLFIGTSVICTYCYVLFLFAPSMVWLQPVPTHSLIPQSNGCGKRTALPISEYGHVQNIQCSTSCWEDTVETYASWFSMSLAMKLGALFVFLALVVMPSILGAQKVHGNLDYRHLLPPDSPSNQGVHYMSDVVWPEFLHILFIIDRAPDFENPAEYKRFLEFIEAANEIPGAIGTDANMMWIYDFHRFMGEKYGEVPVLNMTAFSTFINDDIYGAWKSGVNYATDESGHSTVSRMLFMFGTQGTTSLADKARLMQNCRDLASRFPEFSAIPFDTEVGMADVITQIPNVITLFPLILFGAFSIIFIAFSGNFVLTVVALIAAVPVFIGTVFTPGVFDLTLNPFSVAMLLFYAAVSYKTTSHMCYFYRQVIEYNEKADDATRLKNTMKTALLPTILSSIGGACLFLPVLLSPIVIFQYLALINVTFLVYSLLTSIIFIPALLSMLPHKLTGKEFLISRD